MINSTVAQRILVVASDPSVRELLRYLLCSEGHRVEEAQSGLQALQKLDGSCFDVVLTRADELEVKTDGPFPQVKIGGAATPVLRICDDALSASDELKTFAFNLSVFLRP